MVWQRFAKSPRFVVCRFNSCRLRQLYGPVAQRNQSATLRRSRSHVQIVPGPPSDKDESGIVNDEFIFPRSLFIVIFAGVAQRAGGASFRN